MLYDQYVHYRIVSIRGNIQKLGQEIVPVFVYNGIELSDV